jgi:hypothetical protein
VIRIQPPTFKEKCKLGLCKNLFEVEDVTSLAILDFLIRTSLIVDEEEIPLDVTSWTF